MSIYSKFETDKSLNKSGIVLNFGKNSKGEDMGIRILPAGEENEAYTKRMEHVFKPYQRQLAAKTMDTKLLKKLVMEVYAETVVIDFENIEDRDGQNIPYTKENAIRVFNDLPALWNDIQAQAQDWTLFRLDLQEAAAGN